MKCLNCKAKGHNVDFGIEYQDKMVIVTCPKCGWNDNFTKAQWGKFNYGA